MTVTAYIALGSNLGPRQATLRAALERIAQFPATQITRQSTWINTAPVGGPPGQDDYLNGAIALHTDLPAEELMGKLLAVEKDLGRDRAHEPRHGPRTIDLDLLLYGTDVIHSPTLTVPHPRMHERRFVLAPLAEIAPEALHPILQTTIAELLRRLPPENPRPAAPGKDPP